MQAGGRGVEWEADAAAPPEPQGRPVLGCDGQRSVIVRLQADICPRLGKQF